MQYRCCYNSAAVPVAGIHVSERAEIFALTNIRRCGEKEEEMFNVSGDYERNVSR